MTADIPHFLAAWTRGTSFAERRFLFLEIAKYGLVQAASARGWCEECGGSGVTQDDPRIEERPCRECRDAALAVLEETP